jgi:hypothetical protein
MKPITSLRVYENATKYIALKGKNENRYMKSKGYLKGSIRFKTLFEEFITLCLALTVKVVLEEKNEKGFLFSVVDVGKQLKRSVKEAHDESYR